MMQQHPAEALLLYAPTAILLLLLAASDALQLQEPLLPQQLHDSCLVVWRIQHLRVLVQEGPCLCC